MAYEQHKNEINNLIFALRKCLICVPNLSNNVRAMLLMTIDLSSQNFSQNMKPELQIFYEPYLCNVQKIINQQCNDIENQSPSSDDEQHGIDTDKTMELKQKISNGIGDDTLSSKQQKYQVRINAEYIGKPLNASARLKLAQTQMQNKCSVEEEKLLKEFETTVEDKKQTDAAEAAEKKLLSNVSDDNTNCSNSQLENQEQQPPIPTLINDDKQQPEEIYGPTTTTMIGVDTSFKIFSDHSHSFHSNNNSNNKNNNWPTQNNGTKRDGNYRQRGNRRQNHERKNSTSSQHDYQQPPQQNAVNQSKSQHKQKNNNRDDSVQQSWHQNPRQRRGSGNYQKGKLLNHNYQSDDKRFYIKSAAGAQQTTTMPATTTTATNAPVQQQQQQKHRKNDSDRNLFFQKRINEHLNKNNIVPRKKSLSASVENVQLEENWD